MKSFFILVACGLAVFGLAACAPAGTETSALQIPEAAPGSGLGAISGQVPEALQTWPDEPLLVYAVPFYPNQADPEEGFYVLDTGIHSMTELDGNGNFSINNVTPGSYVLVTGPRAEDSLLVVNPDQSALIIQVMAGQVTILEDLQLAK